MNRLLRAALIPAAILLGAADSPSDVVAERGEVKVTVADVQRMLDAADQAQRARLRATPGALADIVRDRALRDTLLAEARAAKWDQRPDIAERAEEARIQSIVQSYLAAQTQPAVQEATEQEIAAAYEAAKSRFVVPRQYNIAQIAVLSPANSPKEAQDEARRKAADIRAQAVKPKADFADLAKRLSQDKPTADKGGEMGWVREDVLQPAIRDALAHAKEGSVTEPIRAPDSWHVVKVNAVKPAGVMPLEQARETIAGAIRQARAQAAQRGYVQGLTQRQPIVLNEIELLRRFPVVPVGK